MIYHCVNYGTMLSYENLDCISGRYDIPAVITPTIPNKFPNEFYNQALRDAFYMPLREPRYEEILNTNHFKLSDLMPILRVDVICLHGIYYKRCWSNNTIIEIREINRNVEDVGGILFVNPYYCV